jgi:hypothetical protein
MNNKRRVKKLSTSRFIRPLIGWLLWLHPHTRLLPTTLSLSSCHTDRWVALQPLLLCPLPPPLQELSVTVGPATALHPFCHPSICPPRMSYLRSLQVTLLSSMVPLLVSVVPIYVLYLPVYLIGLISVRFCPWC